jgi:hypothetical protein
LTTIASAASRAECSSARAGRLRGRYAPGCLFWKAA